MADVCKAGHARSDLEFCAKLEGALQVVDESQLWLELLRDDCAIRDEAIRSARDAEAGDRSPSPSVTMVNRTKEKTRK